MKIAYADPPYPGKARMHYAQEAVARGAEAKEVNLRVLLGYLCDAYPDGWALSTNASSLKAVLALETCPDDVRVTAWVKTWCVFKVGVNPAYAWEPVLFWRGRQRRSRRELTVRDWLACPATMNGRDNVGARIKTPGAKPPEFWFWLFRLLGLGPGDELHDIFPGSGAGGRAWSQYLNQLPLAVGEAAG
jgi:hypothetical protein